jgi:hypothetical protein
MSSLKMSNDECGLCSNVFGEDDEKYLDCMEFGEDKVTVCSECKEKCDQKWEPNEAMVTPSRARVMKKKNKEGRYECPHCPSTYSKSCHINRHMKEKHAAKPFECDICDRFFFFEEQLNEHLKDHELKTPYQIELTKWVDMLFDELQKINDNTAYIIPLHSIYGFGKYTLVSQKDEDEKHISSHSWFINAFQAPNAMINGKKISLSNFVKGPPPNGKIWDHKDDNQLDNRNEMLREAKPGQNMANKRKYKNNKSGIKGVSPFTDHNGNKYWRWDAHDKIDWHTGSSKCKLRAGALYNEAARKLFKEFANLNLHPVLNEILTLENTERKCTERCIDCHVFPNKFYHSKLSVFLTHSFNSILVLVLSKNIGQSLFEQITSLCSV